MLWTIQAVVGASDVVPCQYLDVMESIHAPLHYFSYAYSRIFNDMIFGEVCLHRFNFVGVNYDFLSTASRIWNLAIFGRPGRSLCGYSDYLENTRSYFLWCFVVIPNLKDTVFGGVYGMDETSDFGVCNYCAIEIYHRVRSLGESNKQVA